jgi:hypothetical protein
MYPIGTLKLTWINPTDFSVLESTMFDKNNLAQALKMAKTKPNFMLFQLIENKGDYYKWKLLPYGEYDKFIYHMKVNNSPITPFAVLAIIGFAAYGVYKTFKK